MEGHQKNRRCRKQDGERGGQDGKERLAMENIGCGWRGSVYGWLIFNVHPRLHPTRLHPMPHAPFEFAFLTSDSTLDTRLSLNARRICSVTPQHRYFFRFGRHAPVHSAGRFVWGGGTLRIRASANGSEPPPALWTSAR
ncbi:hypothetical protein C365_05105 [Cryptococcus neoformans Bt85]|nr:hypothetical protein C365_05105 [Cryptococcus neoformans var. grubii Bt85]